MHVKLKEWIRLEHLHELNPGLSFSVEVVNELKKDVLVGYEPVPNEVVQTLIMLVLSKRAGITFWCRICHVDEVNLPATPSRKIEYCSYIPTYSVGSASSSYYASPTIWRSV